MQHAPSSRQTPEKYGGVAQAFHWLTAVLVLVAFIYGPGGSEAPGEIVLYQGRSYKSYRGMGSIGAMQEGSADRYFQEATTGNPNADKLVPEGIEGRVPYKGSLVSIVYQMAGGVRASMGYCGCATIEEMRSKGEFVQITAAGMRESHVHDVQITKEAPNYRAE
jgi:IMP dehydrogenase